MNIDNIAIQTDPTLLIGGENAFKDCINLHSVTLGTFRISGNELIPYNNIITDGMFDNCLSLKKVDNLYTGGFMGKLSTKIGARAFRNCDVTPFVGENTFKNVTEMGESAFEGATLSKSAKETPVLISFPKLKAGDVLSPGIPKNAFMNAKGYVILNFAQVSSIGDFAFAGCLGLENNSYAVASTLIFGAPLLSMGNGILDGSPTGGDIDIGIYLRIKLTVPETQMKMVNNAGNYAPVYVATNDPLTNDKLGGFYEYGKEIWIYSWESITKTPTTP